MEISGKYWLKYLTLTVANVELMAEDTKKKPYFKFIVKNGTGHNTRSPGKGSPNHDQPHEFFYTTPLGPSFFIH